MILPVEMEDYSENEYDNYDYYDEYDIYNDTYNDISMSYDNKEPYSSEEEDIDDDEIGYRVAKKIAKEVGEE
jgi:hypothetical protein